MNEKENYNIEKNLDSIKNSLSKIALNLSTLLIKNNNLDWIKNNEDKWVYIKWFPGSNNINSYFNSSLNTSSDILKTEIINLPKDKPKEKEYLIYRISSQTNWFALKLLSLSFLWILYWIFDIKISSIFWTNIEWIDNSIPTALFIFILLEIISFLSYYFIDLKIHKISKKSIKTKNNKNILDYKKEIELLSNKNYKEYFLDNIEKLWNNDDINIVKKELWLYKVSYWVKNYGLNNIDIENINNFVNIFTTRKDKNQINWLKEILSLYNNNINTINDINNKIDLLKLQNEEIWLENFNRNFIFIFLKGIYPLILSFIALYFLILNKKININILSSIYEWIWWYIWILIIFVLILLLYILFNRLMKN